MVSDAEKARVGALIRARRQELGLRQPEVARRVGVSRNAVSNWETGRTYPERHAGKVEAVLRISLAAGTVTLLPPADPRERELWDLVIQDRSPAAAWNVIEEYRRGKRRTA
jgi:transcriptional regulator with XRE-family HTH domain